MERERKQIVGWAKLMRKLGISEPTLRRIANDPALSFPQPHKTMKNPRLAAWYEDDVDAWLACNTISDKRAGNGQHNKRK